LRSLFSTHIADEVLAHPLGLIGAAAQVTLESEVEMPSSAPDKVMRVVMENCRTLKFISQGFKAA
jgi:hypothetical protein